MTTPTVNDIRTMSDDETKELNRALTKKLAIQAMSMLFFKFALANLTKTVVKGLEHAAKV
jgi:hypothetical protein